MNQEDVITPWFRNICRLNILEIDSGQVVLKQIFASSFLLPWVSWVLLL